MLRFVVTFHYTLRDPAGRLLDTSQGGDAVSYLEGSGEIIEGLEEQLKGLPAGTKQKIQIPAAKAYGERDETQVQRVLKALLPVKGELKVGDQFQAGEDRFAPFVKVLGVEGDEVLLDANHPLAGVNLTFDVEVIAVRLASETEMQHGHVHGAEGHAACCHESGFAE